MLSRILSILLCRSILGYLVFLNFAAHIGSKRMLLEFVFILIILVFIYIFIEHSSTDFELILFYGLV